MAESAVQTARRHVAEQIERIRRQRELIYRMMLKRHSIAEAEALLAEMLVVLGSMRDHHRKLLKLRAIKPRTNSPVVPLPRVRPPVQQFARLSAPASPSPELPPP